MFSLTLREAVVAKHRLPDSTATQWEPSTLEDLSAPASKLVSRPRSSAVGFLLIDEPFGQQVYLASVEAI